MEYVERTEHFGSTSKVRTIEKITEQLLSDKKNKLFTCICFNGVTLFSDAVEDFNDCGMQIYGETYDNLKYVEEEKQRKQEERMKERLSMRLELGDAHRELDNISILFNSIFENMRII